MGVCLFCRKNNTRRLMVPYVVSEGKYVREVVGNQISEGNCHF